MRTRHLDFIQTDDKRRLPVGVPVPPPRVEELPSCVPELTRPCVYERGYCVFHEGEPVAHVFFIVAGLLTETHSQSQVISMVRLPGSWLGMGSAVSRMPHQTSAVALTDCALGAIPTRTVLLRMTTDVEFAGYVAAVLSRQLMEQRDSYGDCSRRLIRLLGRLFAAASVRGSDGSRRLAFGLSVTQLADGLGASRERVSRLLTRLQAAGILRRDKGWLRAPVGSPFASEVPTANLYSARG